MTLAGFNMYVRKGMCPLLSGEQNEGPLHKNCKKTDVSSILRKYFPYSWWSLIGQLLPLKAVHSLSLELLRWNQCSFKGVVCVCVCMRAQSCLTLWPCGLPPGSSVHGISPGKNTAVCCPFLLQGIFPAQGSNLRLLDLLCWQAYSLLLS